jgi:hypothetical protein
MHNSRDCLKFLKLIDNDAQKLDFAFLLEI